MVTENEPLFHPWAVCVFVAGVIASAVLLVLFWSGFINMAQNAAGGGPAYYGKAAMVAAPPVIEGILIAGTIWHRAFATRSLMKIAQRAGLVIWLCIFANILLIALLVFLGALF